MINTDRPNNTIKCDGGYCKKGAILCDHILK